MCGISGIISTRAIPELAERLRRMTNAIAHRGPDGEGHWTNPGNTAALGHRRLAIIDLTDAGHQPMHSLNRYTLVHNGEIYNYRELRTALEKKGHSFRSQTDSEVILAAYHEYRENCVDHFDGMFAFAIWDEQEQSLFAARDRLGEKPFFYSYRNHELVFASEMKALWADGGERVPNRGMLFNFLTIGYTDNPNDPSETFFNHIYKLPAAHYLQFNARENELTITQYWELDPEAINEKISDEEAIGRFSELFQQSVQRRLRSDVAIGCSLSGGLDSTSIVAAIQQQPGQNSAFSLHSFSAIFPGFEKDESAHIQTAAARFGLHSHNTQPAADGFFDELNTLFHHQEEPFGSAGIYAQYKVFELAAGNGVKVLLDGQGADETLAGYNQYYKWYWQELYRNAWRLRGGWRKEMKAARDLGVTEPFGLKNRFAALFPDFASVLLEKQYLLHALRRKDLSRAYIRQHSREAYYTTPAIFSLNGVLWFNSFMHGLEELLRYADRNAMAHGREVRLPFTSHELVEFLFSLPSRFKIREGRTKWLLRSAMKNQVPDSILYRTDKTGFEPPQKKWMDDPRFAELARNARKTLVKEEILNNSMLDTEIRSHAAYDRQADDWRYLMSAMLFA